jgi:hypothetical protein
VGWCWLDQSGLLQGPVAASSEHGNKPSGFINGGKILDWLRNCQIIKNYIELFEESRNIHLHSALFTAIISRNPQIQNDELLQEVVHTVTNVFKVLIYACCFRHVLHYTCFNARSRVRRNLAVSLRISVHRTEDQVRNHGGCGPIPVPKVAHSSCPSASVQLRNRIFQGGMKPVFKFCSASGSRSLLQHAAHRFV